MGYEGYPFTWLNRRYGPHHIEERLDRFLCSKTWCNHFQGSIATNLVSWVSDHCPIALKVKEKGKGRAHAKRTSARDHYEDMWSPYEACRKIVEDEWANCGSKTWGNPVQQFEKVANNSLAQLKIWSKVEFEGKKRKQYEAITQLKEVKQNKAHNVDAEEIKKLENHINNMQIYE